ncbi:MAG: response regulator transcription factor [Pelomonas sp.]|nr:response regulator transcription factor [Roseateles sp.]
MHILLVEDNVSLATWLAQALTRSGYAVDQARDGESAAIALQGQHFDAVVLDLGLPRMSGRDLLVRLRSGGNDVPVLILTADAGLRSRIAGLNAGADDYLAKPFDLGELEARLRAIARRNAGQKNPELSCGSLRYNTNTREFFVDAGRLHLTPREHAMLEVLLFSVGKTVSKTQLLDSVYTLDDEPGTGKIEVCMSRLRRKLEPSDARIFTLRGLGYLLKRASATHSDGHML